MSAGISYARIPGRRLSLSANARLAERDDNGALEQRLKVHDECCAERSVPGRQSSSTQQDPCECAGSFEWQLFAAEICGSCEEVLVNSRRDTREERTSLRQLGPGASAENWIASNPT